MSVHAQIELSEAFERVSAHFDIAITYPATEVARYKVDEVSFRTTIPHTLTELLRNTSLTFIVSDRGILVTAGDVSTSAAPPEEDEKDTMEEVVMVAQPLRRFETLPDSVNGGYRRALAMKRDEIGFSDSLLASSIAAFPHQNLAEALQHIPGMSVERNKGLGTQVNVRGLPNSFSHVSINGLATASGSGGRDVEFDMFAPEIVQAVTIKKSPSAADKEGGIAGNVYIETARPFDYGERRLALNTEVAHNSISDVYDPAFSFVASDVFGDWAGLLSFSRYARTNRTDSNSGIDFRPLSRWLEKDGSPQALAQSQQTQAVLFRDTGIEIADRFDKDETARIAFINKVGDRVYLNEQDKWGMTASLQHRLNHQLLFSLDVMLGEYNAHEDEYDVAAYSASSSSALTEVHQVDNTTLADYGITVLTDASYRDTQHEMLSRQRIRTTDYQQLSLEGDWQSEDWNLLALIGFSGADKTSDDSNLKHTAFAPSRNRFTAFGGENLPSRDPASIDMYNSPDAYQFDHYDISIADIEDRQYTAQMDAQRLFPATQNSHLSRLQFGFRYTDTSKQHQGGELRISETTKPTQTTSPRTMADSQLTLISDLVPGGDFSLDDGRQLSWQQVGNAYAREIFRPNNLNIPYDEPQYYRVDEEVLALYAMLDISFKTDKRTHNLNIGVRYIDTNILSFGYHQIQHIDGSEGFTSQPISQTGNYNRALPSFNFTAELADDVLLRMAASETLMRPSLVDIAYKRTANLADFKYHDGNPGLHPTLATQWEAGVEWYWHPAAIVSLSYFNKKIEGIVREVLTGMINDVTKYNDNGSIDGIYDFDVYQHINADERYDIKGLELILQLPLSLLHPSLEGFNLNANYINLQNDLTGQSDLGINSPPEGLAEESFNLIAYYESEGFDAHLSYAYKGAYVDYIERDMYPVYRDGYGQLDFSLGYHFNDHLKISFKGINVTDEVTRSYTMTPDFPSQYEKSGRRLILGVGVRF